MAAIRYDIKQGESKVINNPMPVVAVGGSNITPYYLHFPDLSEDRAWVYPYTQSFMYPIDPPQNYVRVNAQDTPPNHPTAPTSTAQSQLTAYDTQQPFSIGLRAAASSPVTQSVASGVLQNVGDILAISCGGAANIGIVMTGNTSANHATQNGTSILIEETVDDVSWNPVASFLPLIQVWYGYQIVGSLAIGNMLVAPCPGASQLRLRVTALGAGEGIMTWTLRGTPGQISGIPQGARAAAFSVPVVVASDQASIPVTPAAGSTVDVTDRVARVLGVISGAVDVTDRAARALGVISGTADVTDRAARLLGVADVSDRGTRQLGQTDILSQDAAALGVDSNPFDLTIAAGATVNIRTAALGKRRYIMALNMQIVTAAAVVLNLQDAGGALFDAIHTDAISPSVTSRPFYGVTGPTTNNHIQLHNTGGIAAGNVAGSIVTVLR